MLPDRRHHVGDVAVAHDRIIEFEERVLHRLDRVKHAVEDVHEVVGDPLLHALIDPLGDGADLIPMTHGKHDPDRSEEHTSELQSLMSISYAVFCLKKKNHHNIIQQTKQSKHKYYTP